MNNLLIYAAIGLCFCVGVYIKKGSVSTFDFMCELTEEDPTYTGALFGVLFYFVCWPLVSLLLLAFLFNKPLPKKKEELTLEEELARYEELKSKFEKVKK